MIERTVCPTLIGREDELSALEDALLEAARGEGRLVVLAGGAGLGKTRLATQLRRQAGKLGCAVLWGSCSEAELSLPYLPFLEAIGNHLSGVDIADLRERLGTSARDLARLFPQLGVDPGVSGGEDPTQAKLRLFEAVLALLQALANARPLLLVLEDIHWADASTHELLDYVARRARALPMLVLATYRLEELDRHHPLQRTLLGWRRSRLAETIELTPLDPLQVGQMVCAIFDEAELTSDFRDHLHQRSEGNPFVLEEMLKDALDRGVIFRTDSGWDRASSITALRIPETVRDTIMMRLERLEAEHVDTLRKAAILGSSFDFATLTDFCGVGAEKCDGLLAHCLREQLLDEDANSKGGYRFRHNVTREVVYEDMTAPQRTRLHSRLADVLEAKGAPHAERAHHLALANRVGEAVPLWLGAAEDAVARHAYLDAARLYERALTHIDVPADRARAQCALGDALWRSGGAQTAAAAKQLEIGTAGLEAVGGEREAAHFRLVLGRCYWEGGDRHKARAQYEAARQAVEKGSPSDDLAAAYLRLAALDVFEARWESAARLAQQGIDTATEAGAEASRIWGYMWLGMAMIETEGRVEEGLALAERSYRLASERGFDWIAGNALHNSISSRFGLARSRESPPLLEAMRQLPLAQYREATLFMDGTVSFYLGHLRRARGSLEAHQELTVPGTRRHTECGIWLARTLVELGHASEAGAFLTSPDPAGDWLTVVWATVVWARCHLGLGTPEKALPAVRDLLTRFGGLPPGRVHGPPELADAVVAVLVAVGDVQAAGSVAVEVQGRRLTWSPWGRRAVARSLLAQGDAAAAQALLVEVSTEFAAAEHRLEEVETRLLLAHAERALSDEPAAVTQLQAALAQARACGAERLAKEATTRLQALGVHAEDAPAAGVDDAAGEGAAAGPGDAIVTGERMVSVLFADVRGYTAMSIDKPPEDVVADISLLQRWARREVERHHGVVDKFVGDAVMATFNIAGATVDHCLDALQAALALRDKAALLGLPLGLGIAVGPAMVGSLTRGANVSVLGEATNLASRLQSQAAAGEILLSAEAYRRLRAWVEERAIVVAPRSLDVKGFAAPVTAYSLRRFPADAE